MENKRRNEGMLIPTVILGVLAIILILIGYWKGEGQHVRGLEYGIRMTVSIFPLLIFAMIVAGMAHVLIPQDLLSKWVGVESGMRGILIGTMAGGLSPGAPYFNLPIVAALLNSGASAGTAVAFLTGWSLWAIARLPLEVGIFGWRFTLIRLASTFLFPPIAGLIAQTFFPNFKL